MGDKLKLLEVRGDDPHMQDVERLAQSMHAGLLSVFPEPEWTPELLGKAITAAAMVAGHLFGQSIAIGCAKTGDQRRAGDAMLTNFRMGTKLGMRATMAAIRATGGTTLQ